MVKLLAPGQRWLNATGDFRTACVDILNVMLQSWGTDGISVPAEAPQAPFTVTIGQGAYTVGTGANISIPRPSKIVRVNWLQDDIETELVELEDDEFNAWTNKTLTNRPTHWHWRNLQQAFGTLNLLWIPSTADQIVLYTLELFAAYTAGANTTTLTAGYELAIRTNLALLFKLEFASMGAELEGSNLAMVEQQARDSLSAIQRLNFRMPIYYSDFPTGEPGKIGHNEFVDGTFYNW